MNFNRIYEYRFRSTSAVKKEIFWDVLSHHLFYRYLGSPKKILDPAGGKCEFINSVPAEEKWAIDLEESFIHKFANSDVKTIVGSNLEVEIPERYFDGIFISNFLEHLNSQEEVSVFLTKMFNAMAKNGKIVVMGPNFKYCFKNYFDFADHSVILTELGLAEHLYGAGFEIEKVIPRFLPLSFRSNRLIPINKFIIKFYLNFPFSWRFFGQQFLVVGQKKF